jgi:hypothetical protein
VFLDPYSGGKVIQRPADFRISVRSSEPETTHLVRPAKCANIATWRSSVGYSDRVDFGMDDGEDATLIVKGSRGSTPIGRRAGENYD